MIRYSITRPESPEFICDFCHEKILLSDLVILRDHCALPEEPTYHLHAKCLPLLYETADAKWDTFDLHSKEAGWLM